MEREPHGKELYKAYHITSHPIIAHYRTVHSTAQPSRNKTHRESLSLALRCSMAMGMLHTPIPAYKVHRRVQYSEI